MREIDMGKYRPYANMVKTCQTREIGDKRVIWPYIDECLLDNEFRSRVLSRKDIEEVAELWRMGYPEIYGSPHMYEWVLYPEEYEDKVVLLENWRRDSQEKKFFIAVLEHVTANRLIGAGLCMKDDRNLHIEMSMACMHPDYRNTERDYKLGVASLKFMKKIEEESGAEYLTVFCETWQNIIQYICFSRMGWKIAGIFPGEFTRWCDGQREYRGCTVHMYKLLGDAQKYVSKPEEWQLIPAARSLWAALEEINKESCDVINTQQKEQPVLEKYIGQFKYGESVRLPRGAKHGKVARGRHPVV